MLYHKLFTEETILDIEIKEDDVKKDLLMRQEHDIPPGYKDAAKKDRGIGDFLIWLTILEVGKLYKKSVIFVTGDEKADWYKKSEKYPLYPRYELVDEFRRISGGCSFHMIRFSRFLELFGAKDEIVKSVEKDEEKTLEFRDSAGIKWYAEMISIITDIKVEFEKCLLLDDLDLDIIQKDLKFSIEFLIYLQQTIPIGSPGIYASLLEIIIGDLSRIYHKRLYLDGGKSEKELRDLLEKFIENIENIFFR